MDSVTFPAQTTEPRPCAHLLVRQKQLQGVWSFFFLSLKVASWISSQYWISQGWKYRWHQAQVKNAGKTKCSIYCGPFLRYCLDEAWDWHHHPVYMNIWSWPFSSFHGARVDYLCLLTNCQCCLDENYKSPTLNFNWGQIKRKKLGVVFFHGLEIYKGYLESAYLDRQR